MPDKHLVVDDDKHSGVMQFKAKHKLKSVNQTIGKLLELAKQEGE